MIYIRDRQLRSPFRPSLLCIVLFAKSIGSSFTSEPRYVVIVYCKCLHLMWMAVGGKQQQLWITSYSFPEVKRMSLERTPTRLRLRPMTSLHSTYRSPSSLLHPPGHIFLAPKTHPLLRDKSSLGTHFQRTIPLNFCCLEEMEALTPLSYCQVDLILPIY